MASHHFWRGKLESCLPGRTASVFCSHAQKDSVLQFAQETAIQVGHNATLHCNFSTSFSTFYIFWYQQRPNQSPQFLLQVSTYKFHEDSGRFSSVLSMEDSQVLLHVQDAKLQDSAVYLCALKPHWCLQHAALYRKVRVL
uniref:Ig-like domain-containing protein n=1 Tax=Anser cygnoides TaxID=8845 RepID=A0A8B9EL61_ANSCY